MGKHFDDENLEGLIINQGGGVWNPGFHGRHNIQGADTPLLSMCNYLEFQ